MRKNLKILVLAFIRCSNSYEGAHIAQPSHLLPIFGRKTDVREDNIAPTFSLQQVVWDRNSLPHTRLGRWNYRIPHTTWVGTIAYHIQVGLEL